MMGTGAALSALVRKKKRGGGQRQKYDSRQSRVDLMRALVWTT